MTKRFKLELGYPNPERQIREALDRQEKRLEALEDMSRVLLAIEWVPLDGELGLACPVCSRSKATNGFESIGGVHDQDCALDAALRKAGVR